MLIRIRMYLLASLATFVLAGCGGLPPATPLRSTPTNAESRGYDVVLFALGLVETDYRFGGKNPEAGLDCSGMVSYVFDRAVGLKLTGSAAEIAHKGRNIELGQLKPGDLVFFNTENQSH